MMVKFMRFSFIFLLLFLALAVTTTSPFILAQASCPTIIEDAITVLGNSCDGIARNNACYGNIDVEAQFNDGFEAPFDAVGDLAQVVNMQRISTSPIDRITEEWGIALLSVQANIPDTIPGQSVIFLLMGDSEIENGVTPEGTLSDERMLVTTRRSGSLRAEPNASSRILTFIPRSTEIGALGISADGQWLRVSYNGETGWIIARMVQTVPTFDTPTSDDLYTPMQSFYLRTGIGQPDCIQAPNTLMVQGPKDFSIDLTVNGAEIRIGSTVFLRNIAPDVMQLIVAEGQATLYPDTPDARIVPTGGFSTICLDAPRDLGVDGEQNDRAIRDNCFWTTPQLFTNWDEFAPLDNLPPDILIYDFTFPDEPITVEDCDLNPDWTDEYIVLLNDNLSLIAPRYNLTAEELGFGNCLSNYDLIYPEQVLQVPPIAVVVSEPPPPIGNPPVAPPPVVTPPPTPFVDLQVTLTTSDTTPEENQLFTYTASVTNLGTQDATNVVINIPCPLTSVEYFNDTSGGTYSIGLGNWVIPLIPAGGTVSFQLNVYARPGEANAGALTIIATLFGLTETDINPANDSSMSTIDIDYGPIIVNDGSQAVANDGFCTLTEAINNANLNSFSNTPPLAIHECATGRITPVDTIQINVNVTVDASVVYNNANGTNALPPITTDMFITGCCANTITFSPAFGLARFFDVAFGSSLSLQNVTLTGAEPPSGQNGGAIYNQGVVNLLNGVVISNNQADGLGNGGGAIYNTGTVVVLTGATIDNNTVGGAGGGGGIKSVGGSVTVNGGVIDNNTASDGGGGILCVGCTLNLIGSAQITDNAAVDGAGIYYTGGGVFTTNTVLIQGNIASNRGGGIFFDNATVGSIDLATFNTNTVTGFGGAFYVMPGATANFSNTTFVNNQNTNVGGQGGVAFNNGTVTFNNTTFTGNLDAGTTATIVVNAGGTTNFSNNSIISVGHLSPQCTGGGFTNDTTNTGGEGSCYP